MDPKEFKDNCMLGMLIFLCSKAVFDVFKQEVKQAPVVYVVPEKLEYRKPTVAELTQK